MSYMSHSSYFFSLLLGIALALPAVAPLRADPGPGEEQAAAEADQAAPGEEGWWQRSKQKAGEWWEQSAALLDGENGPGKAGDQAFAELWQNITPKLGALLQLQQEREELPDSAWFGRDREDNQIDMNALLDEAMGILGGSEVTQLRGQIRELEQRIREYRDNIAEYRQAKVGAPADSTWKTTVADYEEKIRQQQQQIAETQAQIEKLKTEFSQAMREIGLELNRDQVDLLLASVVGDDIIQSSVVYDHVRRLSEQLMTLTVESEEDIAISKRYYGMHTVLLKILLHMQEKFIRNIDEIYLPKIERIVAEVMAVRQRTEQLLAREPGPKRREYLAANLEAQNLTLRTAALYREHLTGQRAKIITARDTTQADLEVALNTYKTVKLSGELVNLLRTSQKSFDLLLNIQVPDLLVFENAQMKKEFANLSGRLAR